MKKVVVGILSYNMPHLTKALYEQLKQIIHYPVTYIILDNGSSLNKITEYYTHRLNENKKLTGGMNEILRIAKTYNPDYVWLCTNDIEFIGTSDPVRSMVNFCEEDKDIGIIHPSMIRPVPDYFYEWMIKLQE